MPVGYPENPQPYQLETSLLLQTEMKWKAASHLEIIGASLFISSRRM